MLVLAINKFLFRILPLLLVVSPAIAENFSVPYAIVKKMGNSYVVTARMHYPLTPRVIEALENSVPITFVQQLQLIHKIPLLGKYWQWKEVIWEVTLHYELRYHALTQQYVLLSLDTLHHQSFPSLENALDVLGNLQNFSLPSRFLVEPEGLILNIRTGLNLHALPAPMRPEALISSKWQLDSSWVTAIWH